MDWKIAQFSLVHQLPYHLEISDPYWFNRSDNGPWSSGRYEGITKWDIGGRESQIASRGAGWFGPQLGPKMTPAPGSFHLPRTKFGKVLGYLPIWMIDEPGEGAPSPRAKITLEAVEYLTYDKSTTGGIFTCGPTSNQFLIFHVRITDCSSSQLEALSTLLSRHTSDLFANRITASNEKITSKDGVTPTNARGWSLLNDLTDIANRLLGFQSSHAFGANQGTLEMAAGGYLSWKSTVKGTIGFNPPPPSRSVVAVPVDPDKLAAPRIFESDSVGEWSTVNQWAWALAAGAQKNTTRVPRCTEENLGQFRADDLLHWSVLTAGGSIGVVRKTSTEISPSESAISCNPLNRASTAYVDIIMFSMRAYSVLTALGNRMQDLNIQPVADRDRYRAELDALHTTQVDFAKIRDRLRATFIPRRPTATQILLNVRRESGLEQLYDNTFNAIQNRSEILTTIYQQLDSDHRNWEEKRHREDSERRRIAQEREDRDREQRQREQEKGKEIREENRHRQNNIIAGAGLLIGTPGVLDMVGISKGPVGFLALAVLYLIGAMAIMFYNRKGANQKSLLPPQQTISQEHSASTRAPVKS